MMALETTADDLETTRRYPELYICTAGENDAPAPDHILLIFGALGAVPVSHRLSSRLECLWVIDTVRKHMNVLFPEAKTP